MKTKERAFWDRLAKHIGSQFESISDFCEVSGISYDTYYTQKARGTLPKIDQLLKMSRTLDIPVEELVDGTTSLTPKESAQLRDHEEVMRIANELLKASRDKLEVVEKLIESWNLDSEESK
jgi:transcriptional regulator with XRE-family HTH domain